MKQKHRSFLSLLLGAAMIFTAGQTAIGWASEETEPDAPVLEETELPQGIFEVCSDVAPSFVLDIRHCLAEDSKVSEEMQLWEALDANQQRFYFYSDGAGRVLIQSVSSGLLLQEEDGADGAVIKFAEYTAPEEETWVTGIIPEETETEEAETEEVDPEEAETEEVDAEEAETEETEAEPETETAETGDADETEPETEETTEAAEAEEDLPDTVWRLEPAEDDSWFIRSASGKYLTAGNWMAACGTSVVLKEYTGGKTQRWRLKRTGIGQTDLADSYTVNPFGPTGEKRFLMIDISFGENTEVLTAADLVDHTVENDEHWIEADEDYLKTFAAGLAKKYDTQGIPRRFTTHDGRDITLYKGDFGWKLNEDATAAFLKETINSENGYCHVEPVWSHEGESFDDDQGDIGDSYIEVDLDAQKVFLYKEGKKLMESDCVSGTLGTDRETPGGVYSVTFVARDAVLRGADYASPVSFWIPFNGGIGLHDASWRSTFGGDIYKTNGSHGCINLPYDAAKTIYEETGKGYPVVVYH